MTFLLAFDAGSFLSSKQLHGKQVYVHAGQEEPEAPKKGDCKMVRRISHYLHSLTAAHYPTFVLPHQFISSWRLAVLTNRPRPPYRYEMFAITLRSFLPGRSYSLRPTTSDSRVSFFSPAQNTEHHKSSSRHLARIFPSDDIQLTTHSMTQSPDRRRYYSRIATTPSMPSLPPNTPNIPQLDDVSEGEDEGEGPQSMGDGGLIGDSEGQYGKISNIL